MRRSTLRPSLCDSNVWLALALSRHVHHRAARAWLDGVEDSDSILFCRATQQAFVRLLTTSAVLAPYGSPPLSNTAAWDAYQALLADHRVKFEPEPEGLQPHWKRLAARDSASPKLWMDAYLAAFAIVGGHRLVTTDGALRQFGELDAIIVIA